MYRDNGTHVDTKDFISWKAGKIMTPQEELELAVAAALQPEMFRTLELHYGHVPNVRRHTLKRARRIIRIVRMFEGEK
jgi:hypothetical protein